MNQYENNILYCKESFLLCIFYLQHFSKFGQFLRWVFILPSLTFYVRSFSTFGHVLGSVILCSVFLRSVFFYPQSLYIRSFYVWSFYLRSFYVQSFYVRSFYVRSFYVRSRFHLQYRSACSLVQTVPWHKSIHSNTLYITLHRQYSLVQAGRF